jgi:perosamine synthetase
VCDPEGGTSNVQSFWVELPDAAPPVSEVLAALSQAGVSARRGIMAAHLEPAYAGHQHGPLPVTEHLTARTLILPLHHDLTDADQDVVVAALAAAIGLQSGVPSYR